jgi:hypothetical protein
MKYKKNSKKNKNFLLFRTDHQSLTKIFKYININYICLFFIVDQVGFEPTIVSNVCFKF